MKFLTLALSATASAMVIVNPEQQPLAPSIVQNPQSKSLIELAPYRTRWVTEEEKWSLKLVSHFFFFDSKLNDIVLTPD